VRRRASRNSDEIVMGADGIPAGQANGEDQRVQEAEGSGVLPPLRWTTPQPVEAARTWRYRLEGDSHRGAGGVVALQPHRFAVALLLGGAPTTDST
jgi:hypothetical protein